MHIFFSFYKDHYKFWRERKKELTKENPPNTKKLKNFLQSDSQYKENAQ